MGWGIFFGLLCLGISIESGLKEIAKGLKNVKY